MARPADPKKAAALAKLAKYLAADASIDVLKTEFPFLHPTTWNRWVKEAVDAHVAGGGKPPERSKGGRPGGRTKEPPRTKWIDPLKAKQRPKEPRATPPSPKEGELLPDEAGDGDKPQGKRCGAGVITDEGTYLVVSIFGAKETSIIDRFVNRPEDRPDRGHVAVLDGLMTQYHNAGALMESSMKRAGDGHAILNETAYGAAVEIQRKCLLNMVQVMREVRSIDTIESFASRLLEIVEQQSPEIARPLVEALREAIKPYTSGQWQQTQQMPSAA